MQKNSNIDNKEKDINLEEENKDSKKKKFAILLVAILILSLITTGLTTNIFGRIGTAFKNEGSFVLKHTEDNEKEVVKNQELKFDTSSLNLSLSDSSGKLSYSYKKIVPTNYTCDTDDATVATCYSADGYIVVYPKSVGSTNVTLRAEANGKEYIATANVVVAEADRYIKLDSTKGTINLSTNKTKEVAYYLVGMNGKVKVTSSDESIAKVSNKNGVLKITAAKVGNVDITVSISYNEKVYTSVYKLEVVKENNIKNDKPVVKKKSRVSTLSSLTVSNGNLKFHPATTAYSIVVDKDVKSVSIDYEKTNANAKVIYTVDGLAINSLKNIPLKDGGKEVIITVTSEDGSSTTSYRIAINRADAELATNVLGVTISGGKVLSAVSPTSYSGKVATDVDKVDITLNLDDKGSTVRYYVDGKVASNGNVLRDFNLKLGKNTVKVVIGNRFGLSMIYFITIEREAPSDNTNIILDVLDDGYVADKVDDNNYTINNVPYDKKDISLSAACENTDCSKISYEIEYADGTKKTLNNLNNVELKEGKNTIAITVVAEDGKTTDTHYVSIYRPIRTIQFENTENKVLVEKPYTDIKYTISEIAEDGSTKNVELDNAADVMKASLSQYGDDVTIEVHQGFVRIIPKNPKNLLDNTDVLTLDYDGKKVTTNLTFDIDEYDLTANNEFDMGNSSKGNTRGIIVSTNLMKSTDATLIKEISKDGKSLKVCTSDKVYCVDLTVDATEDAGDITLSYGKDSESEIGVNDLPIIVTANGDGVSKIHVSGSVYGKSINKDITITINVTRLYRVTILANKPGEEGGKFNAASKEEVFEISAKQSIDLSTVSEPYKIDDDCNYFKFKHYSTLDVANDEEVYNRTDKKIIDGSTLDDDITIYAVYDPSDEKIPETNSLWLKADDYAEGLPLFHNKEYYDKYNKDKIIYPGANGSYVMNFKAEEDMNLNGLVLKENNICVKGKCLNMGYRVRYNEIRRADGTSYEAKGDILFGEKNSEDYWILNQKYGIIKHDKVTYLDENKTEKELDTENRADILFDTPISLNEGDQISITIFWKWVEVDDIADTTIGEYVTNEGASINDKYSLSVGIIYEANNSCPTN